MSRSPSHSSPPYEIISQNCDRWTSVLVGYLTKSSHDYFLQLFNDAEDYAKKQGITDNSTIHAIFQQFCLGVRDWPVNDLKSQVSKIEEKFGNAHKLIQTVLKLNLSVMSVARSSSLRTLKIPVFTVSDFLNECFKNIAIEVGCKNAILFDKKEEPKKRMRYYDRVNQLIDKQIMATIISFIPINKLMDSHKKRKSPKKHKPRRTLAPELEEELNNTDDEIYPQRAPSPLTRKNLQNHTKILESKSGHKLGHKTNSDMDEKTNSFVDDSPEDEDDIQPEDSASQVAPRRTMTKTFEGDEDDFEAPQQVASYSQTPQSRTSSSTKRNHSNRENLQRTNSKTLTLTTSKTPPSKLKPSAKNSTFIKLPDKIQQTRRLSQIKIETSQQQTRSVAPSRNENPPTKTHTPQPQQQRTTPSVMKKPEKPPTPTRNKSITKFTTNSPKQQPALQLARRESQNSKRILQTSSVPTTTTHYTTPSSPKILPDLPRSRNQSQSSKLSVTYKPVDKYQDVEIPVEPETLRYNVQDQDEVDSTIPVEPNNVSSTIIENDEIEIPTENNDDDENLYEEEQENTNDEGGDTEENFQEDSDEEYDKNESDVGEQEEDELDHISETSSIYHQRASTPVNSNNFNPNTNNPYDKLLI